MLSRVLNNLNKMKTKNRILKLRNIIKNEKKKSKNNFKN